jgi:hypothetical protein
MIKEITHVKCCECDDESSITHKDKLLIPLLDVENANKLIDFIDLTKDKIRGNDVKSCNLKSIFCQVPIESDINDSTVNYLDIEYGIELNLSSVSGRGFVNIFIKVEPTIRSFCDTLRAFNTLKHDLNVGGHIKKYFVLYSSNNTFIFL